MPRSLRKARTRGNALEVVPITGEIGSVQEAEIGIEEEGLELDPDHILRKETIISKGDLQKRRLHRKRKSRARDQAASQAAHWMTRAQEARAPALIISPKASRKSSVFKRDLTLT